MRIEIGSNEIPIYEVKETEEPQATTREGRQRQLHDKIKKIVTDMGHNYAEQHNNVLGYGVIAISDDVKISITYNTTLTGMYVSIGSTPVRAKYKCLTNSTSVGDISVELQTAVMIMDTLRSKLR